MSVRPGMLCEKCGIGYLRVYAGKDGRLFRVQYVHCGRCKHRPDDNKVLTPLGCIRRRSSAGPKLSNNTLEQ
jgi:hypothetical protein